MRDESDGVRVSVALVEFEGQFAIGSSLSERRGGSPEKVKTSCGIMQLKERHFVNTWA